MSTDFNPYSSPNTMNPMSAPVATRRVADLGKRLLGAIVDGLIGLVFVGPGYAMMIAGSSSDGGEPGGIAVVGLVVVVVGALALMGMQIYLLATRSQSIGKYVMKTQIVDFESGRPASFVSTFVLRGIVSGLIGGIPCVGAIYSIADICFIFRGDHRCIHDLLAKTQVVDIS